MIIIDTDIVIDVLRKHAPAIAWLHSQSPQAVLLSGFSAMELFASSHDAAQQRTIDQVLARLRVVWPSTRRCERALSDYRNLHLAYGLDPFDALIAHSAIELQLPLHTFNVKHFQHVPGLTTVQPYTR